MSDGNGQEKPPYWYEVIWQDDKGRKITERKCEFDIDPDQDPRFLGHAVLVVQTQATSAGGIISPVTQRHPFVFTIDAWTVRMAFEKFDEAFKQAEPNAKRKLQQQMIMSPGQAPKNIRSVDHP